MSSNESRDKVLELLYGEISPEEEERLRADLARQGDLGELASFEKTLRTFRQALPDEEVPESVHDAIMANARSEAPHEKREDAYGGSRKPTIQARISAGSMLQVAAGVVLLIGAMVILNQITTRAVRSGQDNLEMVAFAPEKASKMEPMSEAVAPTVRVEVERNGEKEESVAVLDRLDSAVSEVVEPPAGRELAVADEFTEKKAMAMPSRSAASMRTAGRSSGHGLGAGILADVEAAAGRSDHGETLRQADRVLDDRSSAANARARALELKGQALLAMGRVEEADRVLSRLERQHPDYRPAEVASARRNVARRLQHEGKNDSAMDEATRVETGAPAEAIPLKQDIQRPTSF